MADLVQLIAEAASRYGVDPALALEVAIAESSLDPNAVGSKGEIGIMQLMPDTAAQYGITDPRDPAQNIDGGVHYLADLLNQFDGDPAAALTAYNWGPGNVAQHGAEAAPASTKDYVAKILGNAGTQYRAGLDLGTSSISNTIVLIALGLFFTWVMAQAREA